MNDTNGTFYAVGVGPGDPELLTLQAVNLLRQCPVIAAPQTRSGQMLALDIAQGALDLREKEILPLSFTMSHEPTLREESYQTAARQIEAFLQKGLDVAMVNLGDVSVFATAYYILERIREDGFQTVMAPGVTSFSAVARKARMQPHPDRRAASHHPCERGFGPGAAASRHEGPHEIRLRHP